MRYDIFGREMLMHIIHEVILADMITKPQLAARVTINKNHLYEQVEKLNNYGIVNVDKSQHPHVISISNNYYKLKEQFIRGLP